MSIIKLTLPLGEVPVNGKQVTFTAPCDCTVTEYLQIDGVNYTIVDALGNCVTGKGGRWAAGATISVTLDVDNKRAYILNQPDEHSADDITSGVLPVERGGTGVGSLAALAEVLNTVGVAKIVTGSYVGTGESSHCLTFGFEPKVLVIQNSKAKSFPVWHGDELYAEGADKSITFIQGCTTYPIKAWYSIVSTGGGAIIDTDITVEFNGNGVEWSAPAERTGSDFDAQPIDPASLFNDTGVTYYYFAIG